MSQMGRIGAACGRAVMLVGDEILNAFRVLG